MKVTILILLLLFTTISLYSYIHKISDHQSNAYNQSFVIENNVAYVVGLGGVLTIIDVADTLNQQTLGYQNFPGDANSIDVIGHFAYVANGNLGVEIIDVADPLLPILNLNYSTPGYAYYVTHVGDIAYVVDSDLQVLDVSDPQLPEFNSTYDIPGIATYVKIVGSTAYVMADSTVYMLDTSNPYDIILIGTFEAQDSITAITVSDNILYEAEANGFIRIIDIANPLNPVILGSYAAQDIVKALQVVGNTLYYLDSATDMKMIDISNLDNPQLLDFFDFFDTPHDLLVTNDKAYVTSDFCGLSIFTVSATPNPNLLGNYLPLSDYFSFSIMDNIAYIADYFDGLKIVDMSNLQELQLLGSYDELIHANGITVVGNFAYVTDSTLCIFDISNPQNPILVNTYSNGLIMKFIVVGNRGYFATLERNFGVLDLTNPTAPILLGQRHIGYRTLDMKVVGHIAYIGNDTGLLTISVADPTNPQILCQVDSGGGFISSIVVHDETVYAANYHFGVQIIDVSNPALTEIVGSFCPHTTSCIPFVYSQGDLLFLSDIWWNEIGIYDISINQEANFVHSFQLPYSSYQMQMDDGKLYTATNLYGVSIIGLDSYVPVEDPVVMPTGKLSLSNYPNPFNPSTAISFSLPSAGIVKLDIFNIKGQKVKSLLYEHYTAGNHKIIWNGMNDDGYGVASGVYFAKINASGKSVSHKLVLIK